MAVSFDKFDGRLQMETFRLGHAEIAHDSAPLFPMRHAWLSRRASKWLDGRNPHMISANHSSFCASQREVTHYFGTRTPASACHVNFVQLVLGYVSAVQTKIQWCLDLFRTPSIAARGLSFCGHATLLEHHCPG